MDKKTGNLFLTSLSDRLYIVRIRYIWRRYVMSDHNVFKEFSIKPGKKRSTDQKDKRKIFNNVQLNSKEFEKHIFSKAAIACVLKDY